ncbi:MAG: LysR family transcriptional regulator [Opitutae bacterium]|nr:LysR family transcriptional regulator [Opitutae bacterium]
MELRHLRYFKAVAELLNFSRAAEQLRVAQPALSRQVRALEEELGATLLDRNHMRVRLTDAGRAYYVHTCKILAQVDMAAAAVREVTEGSAGELIVCNDWHLGGSIVPAALNEFRRLHPRTDVVLHDRRVHDQLALIANRRVHVGFMVRELLGNRREFECLDILRSRLVIVVPSSHPIAERTDVRLAELANETWITVDRKESPQFIGIFTRLCRWSGFTPKLGPTGTTLEGIAGRVASGYGICILPEHMALTMGPGLRAVPSDCAPVELCAVWHREEKSKLLEQFLDVLRRHAVASEPAKAAAPAAKRRKR